MGSQTVASQQLAKGTLLQQSQIKIIKPEDAQDPVKEFAEDSSDLDIADGTVVDDDAAEAISCSPVAKESAKPPKDFRSKVRHMYAMALASQSQMSDSDKAMARLKALNDKIGQMSSRRTSGIAGGIAADLRRRPTRRPYLGHFR
jgi:hypothetical protein